MSKEFSKRNRAENYSDPLADTQAAIAALEASEDLDTETTEKSNDAAGSTGSNTSRESNKSAAHQAKAKTAATTEATVEFKHWFSMRLKQHQELQAHHYPVILAYFKRNNLTERETANKYDQCLKRFGF